MTVLAIIISYLLGSVPTGLWLGLRLRGVDVREHGSRNIGATNTLRVLGKGLGAAALVGDAGKGIVSVAVGAWLSPWPYAPLLCGLTAILGHTFPLYLRFRGGKGVATTLGVFLTLCPLPTVLGLAGFAAVVGATRMVSAGSLTFAAIIAAALYVLPHAWATAPTGLIPAGWTLRIVGTPIAMLIFWRHRSNIGRIVRGEENRIGRGPKAPSGGEGPFSKGAPSKGAPS